ncbi:MAG: 2-oxo acid dehydrogenase subunit E2 [Pirellulales bacterium]|nr:2-oxo acid dehydrogenase subunit E2 [Pirellulales bacterium]
MPTQVKLPSLGENIDSGDVLSIFVSEGDVVAKDQDLIEIETDKATMPIPSPQAGKVVKILVAEGETLSVGGAILELEAADAPAPVKPSAPAPVAAAPAPAEPAPAPAAPVAVAPAPVAPAPAAATAAPAKSAPAPKPAKPGEDVPGDGHASAAAGPAVRRLARELGVDLRRVRPSGDAERITEEDVRNHVRTAQQEATAAAPKGITPPGAPDSDAHGAVRREKMSRMRQTIARNMVQSYTTIPQLTNFDDVDVTELERLRKDSEKDYASQGVKLTAMPLLVKAVAVALKHHPIVNASVGESGEEIVYKEYVNVGIAVDTPKGLMVPVIRDADRKGIAQLARDLVELATAARDGTLAIEDMRGGTFTISNLGAVGGTYSTPIINPPEAAILLVGRSRMMPQFVDGAFQPRLMMPLSLTYDHRIVDGAAAARFLNDVKGYLSNPGRLLLAPA